MHIVSAVGAICKTLGSVKNVLNPGSFWVNETTKAFVRKELGKNQFSYLTVQQLLNESSKTA